MKHSNEAIIYTDGACSGNPGPGGWGAIVSFAQNVYELGGGDEATTNNRMEMLGVLNALHFCRDHEAQIKSRQILIYTDSVYVIRGINEWIHGWKRRGWKNAENQEVANQDIWQELDRIVYSLKQNEFQLKWSFVKGHAGVPGNERCDQIAVSFSKNDDISLYKGSVADYFFDMSEVPPTRPLPDYKSTASKEKVPAWYISYVNGVFSKHQTWSECEAKVKGRAAQFKKVTTQQEEDELKKKWGVS